LRIEVGLTRNTCGAFIKATYSSSVGSGSRVYDEIGCGGARFDNSGIGGVYFGGGPRGACSPLQKTDLSLLLFPVSELNISTNFLSFLVGSILNYIEKNFI